MAVLDVVVPQMGEGLREVLILRHLKKPGGFVKRDEPLYAMETDKAAMDVESPHEGILIEWLAEEGDVLAVGASIARIEGTSTPAQTSVLPAVKPLVELRRAGQTGSPRGRTDVVVPPRSRAYCRKLGIQDEEIARIPVASGTLMPDDVDRYVAGKSKSVPQPGEPTEAASTAAYKDHTMPSRQRAFNFRLKRSATLVVPATMIRSLDWQTFGLATEALRRRHPGVRSSDFETFAFAVARACRDHPEFRSTLIGERTVRRYDHLNMGIAVQRPDCELVMAVVPEADRLDFPTFAGTAQRQVARALDGEDQVDERVQLHLNHVSAYAITDASPVLVAPAIAVVFLGAPYGPASDRQANLGVTFDHRLINGMQAGAFLGSIAHQVEGFAAEDFAPQDRIPAQPELLRADSIGNALRAAEPGVRREMLQTYVTEQVMGLVEPALSHIDPLRSLSTLDLNSLKALELTNRLARDLGMTLPASLLWTYPTIAELASHLTEQIGMPQQSVYESQGSREKRSQTGANGCEEIG